MKPDNKTIIKIHSIIGKEITFKLNSEDLMIPAKFEAKIFFNGQDIGTFECYKIFSTSDYNLQFFTTDAREPIYYGYKLDYKKQKAELTILRELTYQPDIFSPLSLYSYFGKINFIEYLYMSQPSTYIDDKIIKSIEEEHYVQFKEKIKSLYFNFEDSLTPILKLQKTMDAKIILIIEDFSIKFEAYDITQTDKSILIAEYTDQTFNNYMGDFYLNNHDELGYGDSHPIIRSLVAFIFFEILTTTNTRTRLNNLNIAIIVDDDVLIHIGSYFHGTFYLGLVKS